MNFLGSIFIALLAAFFGTWVGIKYSAFVSNRQERAILVIFVQEFSLLLRRSAMYYHQMLKGGVSYSTLFEISDSSTFSKLAEVVNNMRIIQAAQELKADFLQVARYAKTASEAAAERSAALAAGDRERAESLEKKAMTSQATLIAFFAGDLFESEGTFARHRYKTFMTNMYLILGYLRGLNSPGWLEKVFIYFSPALRRQRASLEAFVENQREILRLTSEQLDLLREKERLRHSIADTMN